MEMTRTTGFPRRRRCRGRASTRAHAATAPVRGGPALQRARPPLPPPSTRAVVAAVTALAAARRVKSGQRGKVALARSPSRTRAAPALIRCPALRPQRAPSTRDLAVADVALPAAHSLALTPAQHATPSPSKLPSTGMAGKHSIRTILQSHVFTQIETASSPLTKHRSPLQLIFQWLPNDPPLQGWNSIK
jgi:hypothetical protein